MKTFSIRTTVHIMTDAETYPTSQKKKKKKKKTLLTLFPFVLFFACNALKRTATNISKALQMRGLVASGSYGVSIMVHSVVVRMCRST